MRTRKVVRVVLSVVVITSTFFLIGTNVERATTPVFAEVRAETEKPPGERTRLAPPRRGITVVTSHEQGDILALWPNGTVLYHASDHDGYWDVDPSPNGRTTVVYAATDKVRNRSICRSNDRDTNACIRQNIERVNLTTGEVTVLYSRVESRYHASEWHDVDRINGSHYVVADMFADEVFIVNVSSGMVVWEWTAQQYAPLSSGGPYPSDWVHLNDVEVLEDGRIMVSLRNLDQVVFLDRRHGIERSWTLGTDDDHDRIYEQHNPDYIPADAGGPALLVSDSENNRIVEYQRTESGWKQAWTWQDPRLQWPRDADRLPNGHTLVTDTHGGRVFEVDRTGEIVWQLDVPTAYEAERLGTGDESTGGQSATKLGLRSQTIAQARGEADTHPVVGVMVGVKDWIKRLFPAKMRNGIENATPTWFDIWDALVLVVTVVVALGWLGLELRWSRYELQRPIVRR